MLIADYPAFPGNIARSGDVVSEMFFDDPDLTEPIAAFIERTSAAEGLDARVDRNTILLQRLLDVVSFDLPGNGVVDLLRRELPAQPLSLIRLVDIPGQMPRYFVVAHNVRYPDPERFDDVGLRNEIDGVLSRNLRAGYRRVTR